MQYRIAICDDEKDICVQLSDLIALHFAAKGQHTIEIFPNGEQLVNAYETKDKQYDLIILDIEMPVLNGLEAGQLIRSLDNQVSIIILTNYEAYAREAYSFHPYHYLLKPVAPNELIPLLNALYDQWALTHSLYLYLNLRGNFIRIALKDIIYFESNKRQVFIYTINNKQTIYAKLSDIYPLLDNRFAVPHKSFIINIDYMERTESTSVTLKKFERKIPISKGKKKKFINQVKEYIGDYV